MLVLLVLMSVLLQQLFFQRDALPANVKIHRACKHQKTILANLNQDNQKLADVVRHLHRHDEIIEREARFMGGLVQPHETFFLFA